MGLINLAHLQSTFLLVVCEIKNDAVFSDSYRFGGGGGDESYYIPPYQILGGGGLSSLVFPGIAPLIQLVGLYQTFDWCYQT